MFSDGVIWWWWCCCVALSKELMKIAGACVLGGAVACGDWCLLLLLLLHEAEQGANEDRRCVWSLVQEGQQLVGLLCSS